MRNYTRLVSLLLCMLLALASMTAIADSSELEHVTLDWYVCEGQKPDQAIVFEAINKYFEETINTTLNIHFVPADEYSSKVGTIVDSKQPVDIVNAMSSLPYVDYVKKGAFIPMEDLLPEYAPKTYEMIPAAFWDAMKIDGHIYGVPSYKDSVDIPGVIYNKTMMDRLGIDLSDYHYGSLYDIIPLYQEIQEKRAENPDPNLDLDLEGNLMPLLRDFGDYERYNPYESIIGNLVGANIPGIEAFEGQGVGEKVFSVYSAPEYREFCHTVRSLVDTNICPEQVWWWDSTRTYTAEGRLGVSSYGSGYVTVAKNQASNNYESGLLISDYVIASTAYLHGAVNCISVTSQNPERAMMVLELINTDPFVATALRFGLEGTHWNKGEDGVLDFTGTNNEDPTNRGYYAWYGAQFGSFMYSAIPEGYPANFVELIKTQNENAIPTANMGFIFDPTPVANEIAACSAVVGEYTTNLLFGFIEEALIDETVDAFVAGLDAAGIEAVVAEAQAQLDAWRAVNR